jgi:ABC-2 type transport system ATP-binding protein
MEYAIETFSLSKVFSDWWGRNKVYAVDGLNLRVKQNEIFGLLGPNGSGKTTTLKMLLGLLHPTKGKAIVLGGDSRNPKISSRIGFLPEESYLYKYLNARETLEFYGRLFGLPTKVRRLRTEALLDMVGLKAVASRPVGTFSKGMARRIGLAQALINDPDLLILDEPTTGLDPIGTRQIKDLVTQLAKRGKTILLCSHLLADVEDICDRIAILYGGKIQTEGCVLDLLKQTTKRQIITGAISDMAVEKIKEVVEGENAELAVTSPMDKLETFFIKTVMAAQRQGQPTSGAVSTTQIGEFLAAQTIEESILDKLVSAPVSEDTTVAEDLTKETSDTIEISASEPDTRLLSKLTLSEPVKETDTIETEPVKPKPIEEEVKPDISVLDRLTGDSGAVKQEDKESNHGQEELSDA